MNIRRRDISTAEKAVTQDLQAVLSAFSHEAQMYYGERLNEIVLFGSFARNEGTIDSDIDLLLIFNDDISPVKEIRAMNDNFVIDLNAQFQQLISVVPVTITRYQHTATAFLQTVKREGISLWKR